MTTMKLIRPTRGRPRKFGRPSHAVTLTLPDDVIMTLRSIDDDVSRAVVRLAQPIVGENQMRPPAELERYGDRAVILLRPAKALNAMRGVRLVPLPDGRALISLDGSLGVHEFELRLRDALAEGDLNDFDKQVVSSIAEILKTARRTRGVVVEQRSIIVIQSGRRPRK